MSTDIDRERALYSFRSFTTIRLREIAEAPVSQGTVARELAEAVLQERYPYIASEEASIDVIPALSPDVLDTIRVALKNQSFQATRHMNDYGTGTFWADELKKIDRARRALGLED